MLSLAYKIFSETNPFSDLRSLWHHHDRTIDCIVFATHSFLSKTNFWKVCIWSAFQHKVQSQSCAEFRYSHKTSTNTALMVIAAPAYHFSLPAV